MFKLYGYWLWGFFVWSFGGFRNEILLKLYEFFLLLDEIVGFGKGSCFYVGVLFL